MRKHSFLLFFCISFSISAFKLSPMSQSLYPERGEQHLIFSVQNQSSEPIAVELSVAERKMDEWGKETYPEVEDQFIIFPDQIIVKAGQKRSVKVTYLGNKKVAQEKSFRLIAEQLPIEVANQDKGKRTNIRILLKYVAALYITPKKAKSNLILNLLKWIFLLKHLW